MPKPEFQKTEVVVKIRNNDIKLSSQELETEMFADVVYVGKKVQNYEVGDQVLIDKKLAKKLTVFGGELWKVVQEDFVICKVVD